MIPILELNSLVKIYSSHGSKVRAVDNVSLTVNRGTTFGLVGESGSGKSTLARCALNLIKPTSGTSTFEGKELGAMSSRALRSMREGLGIVFQNPMTALNPRMTVAQSVAEPLQTHTSLRGSELRDRVRELLAEVGLADDHAGRLPHQLSGGQAQRVGIARALATRPRLLVLDEPTSALDVSVQAQILNLLRDLRDQHGLTYLLISHDLEVVRYMSDTVAVMLRGQVVEEGPVDQVMDHPNHEYTRTLLSAMPGRMRTDLTESTLENARR